jgi:succinoglycan biosynthesis protein ExoO
VGDAALKSARIEPVVSVIIPAYNAAQTVTRAIDSALAQTFGALEVLVIDDASTDGTAAMVADRHRHKPQVRVIVLAENGGPARARNIGIAASRGAWIGLLDADDAWLPTRLERMLAAAPGQDAVFDNLMGYEAAPDTTLDTIFPEFPDGPLTLEALMAPQAPASGYDFGYLQPLMRRNFLNERGLHYDEAMRTSEDLLLCAHLLLEGAHTRMIDEPLYLYTLPVAPDGTASASSHTRPRDNEVRAALERMLARYREGLDARSVRAVERRIEYLRVGASISEFYHARRRRNYGRMAYLLARHPTVQREALRRMWRRLAR